MANPHNPVTIVTGGGNLVTAVTDGGNPVTAVEGGGNLVTLTDSGMNPVTFIGGAAFSVSSADFDGSTDYIRWTSDPWLGDSDEVSFIARFRRDVSGEQQLMFQSAGGRLQGRIESSDTLNFQVKDAANAVILSETSTATITDSNFHVIFCSIKTTALSTDFQMWIDDTDYTPVSPTFNNNNAVDLTAVRQTIGASSAATPATFFNGCLGPFFISDEYIDWSVDANRERVISAPGVITDPGTDGSAWSPTATIPEIFILDTYNASGTNGGSLVNPDTALTTPGICA